MIRFAHPHPTSFAVLAPAPGLVPALLLTIVALLVCWTLGRKRPSSVSGMYGSEVVLELGLELGLALLIVFLDTRGLL